ncbi:peptide deformylase [Streptobacillus felis]|uniref:Peptide deformylase n=1 Tax=Streptobacillus felis TaxID=1384509 RepID=A0A7Z0TAQ8_9FUSO|nr:peptide deformylase [Streptobacillus felis]NYV28267.1 peptide deformylase [Streptobacillus felis]
MKIYVYEAPILRKKSENVTEFNDELRKTLDEMVETMRSAKGIGLAANQVGIDKRFFVLEIEDEIYKVVNPEIIKFGDDIVEFEEGCLSIPGIYKKVLRPDTILVRYQDENGNLIEKELNDVPSRAFQHEFDHLEGVLFIDKISPMSRNLIRKKLELMKKNSRPREF